MDPTSIEALLRRIQAGETSIDAGMEALRALPFQLDGDLTVDHHRALRIGLPEAVWGADKTPNQIVRALRAIHDRGQPALATRVDAARAHDVLRALPTASHDEVSRTVRLGAPAPTFTERRVAIACAGTSDVAVAEEARATLTAYGAPSDLFADVGVAGLHRVLARRESLARAAVVIVVAGMEGALPSVVGGLVGTPIIAVPTSVGYGAGTGGIAALLGMLSSCAPGVTVVNVDNGFGAACAALRILKTTREEPRP